LPQTGEVAKNMALWIEKGILLDGDNKLIKFTEVDDKGIEETKAKGYEIVSKQTGTVDEKEIVWQERLLIVNSPKYAEAQARGLEKRIQNATTRIIALTPAKGRGKKQITNEADLVEAVEAILKQHAVSGMIAYEYIKEVERQEKYVGRGRGSADREKQIIEKVRYVLTSVVRQTDAIEREVRKFGWKVYATDVSSSRLSFVDAMKCYRNEYRIERIFNQLKSRYDISPLFVKRDDQAEGLANLLTLGVRVASLIQYVARRSLEESGDTLTGLHLENPKKATNIPTCERLLRAFSKINLIIVETGDSIIRHITPLSHLQTKILELLSMDATVYNSIAELAKPIRC
jgi:transposase